MHLLAHAIATPALCELFRCLNVSQQPSQIIGEALTPVLEAL